MSISRYFFIYFVKYYVFKTISAYIMSVYKIESLKVTVLLNAKIFSFNINNLKN